MSETHLIELLGAVAAVGALAFALMRYRKYLEGERIRREQDEFECTHLFGSGH